jgi:hypothetical protein
MFFHVTSDFLVKSTKDKVIDANSKGWLLINLFSEEMAIQAAYDLVKHEEEFTFED